MQAQTEPENRPTPLEALLLPETPTALHYRRNHFPYPWIERGAWGLEVGGAVEQPLRLSLGELRALPSRRLSVLLECAGHRRTEYVPAVGGVPWKLGALGQAAWAGCSLAEVLRRARVRPGAVEVVLYGTDRGPFKGVEGEHPFARSLPLAKALHPDTLLAWEMNGEPLPEVHGAPVRAVVPGWYAMDSVKWLLRIEVVTEPFRGPFQELDYRFQGAEETGIGRRLTAIPVHALLLSPTGEEPVRPGRREARGIAWGGTGGVASVELRVDEGPWTAAELSLDAEPYGKRAWTAAYEAPAREHVLAVRATDGAGETQPETPVWNRRGYANNSIHRVRMTMRKAT